MGDALSRLSESASRAIGLAHRPPDEPFVVHVGAAAPVELAMAAGLRAVRLLPVPGRPAPRVDGLGPIELGWRGRSVLEQLLALGQRPTAVLLSGPGRDQAQLYATLRELDRLRGGAALPPCRYLDLPTLPHRTTALYRRRRLREAMTWLQGVAGAPLDDVGLRAALQATARRDRAWSRLARLREGDVPALSGTDAAVADRAGAWLPAAEHADLLDQLADQVDSDPSLSPRRRASRMLVVGRDLPPEVVEALEQDGTVVGGSDTWPPDRDHVPADAAAHLADRVADRFATTSPARGSDQVADHVVTRARAARADHVVHAVWEGDEAEEWDATRLGPALERASLTLRTLRLPDADVATVCDVAAGRPHGEPPAGHTISVREPSPDEDQPRDSARTRSDERSQKVLEATAGFGRYQRAWFDEVRARARDGEPFAVVNADFPHELLRALDIPYVVNQWWASVVGAKRSTPRFMAALREHDYAATVEPYSTQGLASALLPDDEQPWGGLPRPTILGATLGTDPTAKIFTSWARETGAGLYLLERSVESRWEVPIAWWDQLADHWDEVLEDARLDLMRDELVGVVRQLERQAGRRFDEGAFEQALHHANAQAAVSRQTRDLVAAARPTPAGVVDLMPATMIPQWHRGTAWAVDAARRVRDEVAGRVEAGRGVVADERLRLMWVGRGFWGNTGLYQCLEDSHGAVFVWSMYLGLAADGYLRRLAPGQDAFRALASRFLTMGDELRMPTWAGPWHVKEARHHGVDGAVAIADADAFVVAALRAAGVPVLTLDVDNLDADRAEDARARMARFADDLRDGRVAAYLAGATRP